MSRLFNKIDERHYLTFGVDVYRSIKQTVDQFSENKKDNVSITEFQ